MTFSDLQKSIISTIAYFDVFDYPLTLVEIHKWLYQPDQKYSLLNISEALDSDELAEVIDSENGFYFLKNRNQIVQTRLERYSIAEPKFKIALKVARCLRWLAFVQGICVCNNVGYNNGNKKSDIDFFIIVQKGRLWWARLVVTLVTTFLGLRRRGKKVVDRVCLSFYVASDYLNLSDIAIKPNDIYLTYWFATLAPIYNNSQNQIYQELIKTNGWLKNYLPNFKSTRLSNRRSVQDSQVTRFSKKIDKFMLNSFIGNWLEKIAKLIQIKKIKRYVGSAISEPDAKVVMSDSILKLHKTDRRRHYFELWQKKLKELNIC